MLGVFSLQYFVAATTFVASVHLKYKRLLLWITRCIVLLFAVVSISYVVVRIFSMHYSLLYVTTLI